MTTPSRFLKLVLVFLTLLSAHGVSSAQSLYDVVVSLSDRQRVVSQRDQVAVYLNNQNNPPSVTDQPIPDDDPIGWLGVGANPTQSAVDGLGIGGKIALLNHAVLLFDDLKFSFLNSSPGEFESGATVGALKYHTSGDFSPLPRATPENYHELLRLLAQRVRALRLTHWPAAFRVKNFTDETYIFEQVDSKDPNDSNNDGNREPFVKIITPDGTTAPESVAWTPDSIGPGNLDVDIYDYPYTSATSYDSWQLQVQGSYNESPSYVEEIAAPLRSKRVSLSGYYPEEARISATAPGAAGTQIEGTVFVLRRSQWHQIDVDAVSSRYEKNEAGYIVEGSSSSGTVSLFGSPPSATVNGSWITTGESSTSYGNYLTKTFVESGYQHKEAWVLPSGDEGHSDDYTKSYEQNWKIGCSFHSVFKPTFTRGVDATDMRTKLESADLVLAENTSDGNLLLHPRPSLLFGIDLGPGLKGAGNGYVSTRTLLDSDSYGYFGYHNWYGYEWNPMMRFDSSYSLQIAGSHADYHVVYENDRGKRFQSLPADSIGWPYTDENEYANHDTTTLYHAWDSPRLKQVAGRDLVADITYDTNHYGGYTVRIYRRPTGSTAPTPGKALNLSGMTLIRTWEFSRAGGSAPHPTDPEKLEVAGSGGEKYEIRASEILPNQGLGWDHWYYEYGNAWWQWTEGTHSWTLKLSQGTTEKFKKEIEIITSTDENESTVRDVAVRESLDGQLVSALTSTTLNPFTDSFPSDWKITAAGKTITGSAVLAYDDPASGYGKWPVSASIQYDGIQPDASYTWDIDGLLSSAIQGPWTASGSASGDTCTLTQKLNSGTFTTTATQFSDGGNKVKTSTTTAGETAWSEVEYGDATSGLPGLPRIVRNSDGSGATYDWQLIAPSNENQLTLTEGLLSGNSVSRGTRVVQKTNAHGQLTGSDTFLINGGTIQTGGSAMSVPTGWGAPTTSTDYNTGLTSTWSYNNNLSRLSSYNNLLGVESSITGYDSLGRPGNVTTNGISAAKTYTASTAGFITTSTISGSATGNLTETRDALGRLTSSNTTWNNVTDNLTISFGTSSNVLTRNQSLLGTHQATLRKDDGTTASSSGPTLPFGGNNGTGLTIDNGLFKTTSQLADQSAAFQTTWIDAWGRVHKTTTAKGTTELFYSPPTSTLQRVRITDPTGRKTIIESDPYSTAGAISRSGIDVDGNGELSSGDRYVESTTKVSGGTVLTTLSLTENSGLREILRTTWNPAGNKTVTTLNGGEETITRTPSYGLLLGNRVKTESTKGWEKNETFNNLGLTTSSALSGTGVPAATLTPEWRADGSLAGVTFTTGGDTHGATFEDDGTLARLKVPADTELFPGGRDILGGHSISGGVETLTVDGVTNICRLDGTLETISGGDVIGKTEALATSGSGFKHTTTPAVGAATELVLHASGAPTTKNYAAGPGEVREFLSGGLLKEITLARGGKLAFGYSNDGAKDLTSATWPQVTSGSPAVFTLPASVQSYGYDRAGRIDEIGDSSGARSLVYQNGRLKQTTWNSGALAGHKVVKGLDSQGRDTGFELWRGNTLIHSASKAPNGVSGEVSEIASGNLKIVISRNAARQVTDFQWGNTSGTFVPTVTQTWQRGTAGRILSASSNVPGAPTFNYKGTANNEATAFDARGRRLKCATAGGEWAYTYTNGRLTNATHPTLGSFSYQFDGIGRRTDMGSVNTSDLLNRTLAWTNTQNKTVKVTAHPDARVWVGIGTAAPAEIPSFTGAYSYPITPPGSSGGWVAWNTLAVLEGQGDAGANPDAKAEQSGAVWVPPVSESFTYDEAGNRQSSSLWDFGWDAKNQLVRARTKNHTSAAQGYDINSAFDAEGRRFSKKVNRYQNGQIVEQNHITYLHDGNDLIYERHQLPSGLTTLERKYVWGPDLSGTHGGAGGAGGLLLILETKGNVTTAIYPLYDGTGHVVALSDSSGNLQAEYAYGPFGENIYARGPHAQSCPFRFQTKFLDQETGLYNFGLRFLDPITGQWLSREPLGESESLNLYSLTGNDPINHVDAKGLAKIDLKAAPQIIPVPGMEGRFQVWFSVIEGGESGDWEQIGFFPSSALIGAASKIRLETDSAYRNWQGIQAMRSLGDKELLAGELELLKIKEDTATLLPGGHAAVAISREQYGAAAGWIVGEGVVAVVGGELLGRGLSYAGKTGYLMASGSTMAQSRLILGLSKELTTGALTSGSSAAATPLYATAQGVLTRTTGSVDSGINSQLSNRFDAFKAWKTSKGYDSVTTGQFRRFMGAHRPGSAGSTLYEERSGFVAWSQRVESIHGNTAGSQNAWLYRLETSSGEFLKWGVTGNLETRYPSSFIPGGRLLPVQQGPRWQMLQLERNLTELYPGPLNREAWAGSNNLFWNTIGR